MPSPFPEPIRQLPPVDLPFEGAQAYLSQAEGHQILFMEFAQDVELPEHAHEAQWGIVLEGEITLTIDGQEITVEDNTTVLQAAEDALESRDRIPAPESALYEGFSSGPTTVGLDLRPV